jgi:predicted transcriptional regulator
MKTATLPAVRVQPEMRALAESVLNEGESLSMFIEDSLKKQIAFRKSERDFIARGMASAARAKETGIYFTAEESLGRLRAMLEAKKLELKQKAA